MDNDLFCGAGGFSAVPNWCFEALGQSSLTALEMKVLACIARHTYGYGREYAPLSATYIARFTNSTPRGVKKAIKNLTDNEIIAIENRTERGRTSRIAICSPKDSKLVNHSTLVNSSTPVNHGTPYQCTTVHYTSEPPFTQINKNINKTLNKNNICSFFEELWKLYPNKKGQECS